MAGLMVAEIMIDGGDICRSSEQWDSVSTALYYASLLPLCVFVKS